MIAGLRTFSRLPRPKQRLVGSAYVLLLITEALLSLPLVSIPTVQRVSQGLSRLMLSVPKSTADPEEIAWAINVLSPYLPASVTCLRRAIVAHAMLHRHGYPAELRIGVMKSDATLAAHAWVEYEGRIVIGNLDDLSQYMPLPTDETGLRRRPLA